MSCDNDSAVVLRQADLKVTPQRILVLSALRHAGGHLTATQVYEQVRAAYPYVDISTVYRTLSSLRQLRLITETNLGGEELTYEWARPEPHHHLICTVCGHIQEFSHSHLTQLAAAIEKESGFHAYLDHFAIFGRCSACRATD